MSEGHVIIKGSRRPDGTYRKDVVRKAGYVPEDEQAKYHDKVCSRSVQAPQHGLGSAAISHLSFL